MCLQFGFVIFWRKDFGAKAAHKMLVKLTPGQASLILGSSVTRLSKIMPFGYFLLEHFYRNEQFKT
jgi:hypothetical protein